MTAADRPAPDPVTATPEGTDSPTAGGVGEQGAETDIPVVTVGTMTRHYLVCERCQLQPMFWGQGYTDLVEAEAAAQKHHQAHEAQPYCICDTVPSLVWDDDDDDDVGHGHCRHRGRCCECGCLTKQPRTTPPGVSP